MLTIGTSARLFAAPILLFAGATGQQDPIVPDAVLALDAQLMAMQQPVRFTAYYERSLLQLHGGLNRDAIRQIAEHVVGQVAAGAPFSYRDALEAYNNCLNEATSAGENTNTLRYWVDYAAASTAERHIIHDGARLVQSELLVGGLSYHFNGGLEQVRVAPQKEESGSTFITLDKLLYPLRAGPDLMATWSPRGAWSESSRSDGCLLLTLHADKGGALFKMVVPTDGQFLESALFQVRIRQAAAAADEYVSVLTFYRTRFAGSVSNNALPFVEVVQFDTLGAKGQLTLRRIILSDVGTGPTASDIELRLPVSISDGIRMFDARAAGEPAQYYGNDVASWPNSILDVLQPL